MGMKINCIWKASTGFVGQLITLSEIETFWEAPETGAPELHCRNSLSYATFMENLLQMQLASFSQWTH